MSLHTTTTGSFALTKYSRSYGGSAGHNQLVSENGWQHFTNPVMKLLLDVKKSPSSGELLSLRLRILWCIEMQASDMQVDQREVIFVRAFHVVSRETQRRETSCRKTWNCCRSRRCPHFEHPIVRTRDFPSGQCIATLSLAFATSIQKRLHLALSR